MRWCGAPLTFPKILQRCPVPEVVLTDETWERDAVPGPEETWEGGVRCSGVPSGLRIFELPVCLKHVQCVTFMFALKELTRNVHHHPISDDLITNTRSVAATRRFVSKR